MLKTHTKTKQKPKTCITFALGSGYIVLPQDVGECTRGRRGGNLGLMRKLHNIVFMALKNTSASKVFGPSMKKK